MSISSRLGRRMSRLAVVSAITSLVLTVMAFVPAAARLQEGTNPPALIGAFSVSIAEEDVPPELTGGASLIGRWTLTLSEDGTYSLVRHDVGEIASGTFESGPASLTFLEWQGIVGCGNEASAAYAWRQVDDRLVLTPIDDRCAERLVLLTSGPFGRLAACEVASGFTTDPFAVAAGTPAASVTPASGVAAQEGDGGTDVGAAIDDLLLRANGCWATGDTDSFMRLHSEGLLIQIATMGPPESFTRELLEFMERPLSLQRIGDVTLDDPNHGWAYVEVNLDGNRNPQRVNFVQEHGIWRFDSFVLFGPPLPGSPTGLVP